MTLIEAVEEQERVEREDRIKTLASLYRLADAEIDKTFDKLEKLGTVQDEIIALSEQEHISSEEVAAIHYKVPRANVSFSGGIYQDISLVGHTVR